MTKKRNKKYNPNKLIRPKVHKLQMTVETQEKDRRVSLWRLLNGKTEHDLIPMDMFMDLHQGDLAIALRKRLIPEKQSFHIQCKIHARNKDTGETVDIDYELASPDCMTIWQFLEGEDDHYPDESIYVTHGNGLRTKWEGFNVMLEKYLDTVGDDDYKMISNHCTITCFTACNSFADEAELKAIKIANLRGLGVGT